MQTIYHHKYESAGNPEIGNNGTWVGTATFQAVKFGNGVDGSTANYHKFPFNMTQQFAVSLYWMPDHNKSSYPNTWIFHGSVQNGNTYISVQLYVGNIYIELYQNSVNRQYMFAMPDYSSGDKIHLVFVFDSGASDRTGLYWNKTPISVAAKYSDQAWSAEANAGCGTSSAYGTSGAVDNMVIANGAPTQDWVDYMYDNETPPSEAAPVPQINFW